MSPTGRTILVVDDDPHVREVVRFALDRSGFRVVAASDGAEALRLFAEHGPELVILDIVMPELDGTEVCRRLRRDSRVPIVFLSSKDDEIDRIVGLELGGDDYVTKPFSPRELVARVKAVLRRTADGEAPPAGDVPEPLRLGALELDPLRFEVRWQGQPLTLTVTEFGLLQALSRHPGRVYSRAELIDLAYRDQNVVTERTIDSHVRRLRRKFAELGGDPVETVHGVGYRLRDT